MKTKLSFQCESIHDLEMNYSKAVFVSAFEFLSRSLRLYRSDLFNLFIIIVANTNPRRRGRRRAKQKIVNGNTCIVSPLREMNRILNEIPKIKYKSNIN